MWYYWVSYVPLRTSDNEDHTMKNVLKKSMQFSMGVYVKTRKEVQGLINELVKNKYLDKKEGEKLVEEAMMQSKKIEAKVERQVRNTLAEAIKKLKVVTQKDLAILERKLRARKKK